jgi:hypothetical protein
VFGGSADPQASVSAAVSMSSSSSSVVAASGGAADATAMDVEVTKRRPLNTEFSRQLAEIKPPSFGVLFDDSRLQEKERKIWVFVNFILNKTDLKKKTPVASKH